MKSKGLPKIKFHKTVINLENTYENNLYYPKNSYSRNKQINFLIMIIICIIFKKYEAKEH